MMLNYSLNTNSQNNVLYIMKAGNDYVYGTMPYANAVRMCDKGNVARGDNPNYPVAVDGKYFFFGQLCEPPEPVETEETEEETQKVRCDHA